MSTRNPESEETRLKKSVSAKKRAAEKPHTMPNNKGRVHTEKARQNIVASVMEHHKGKVTITDGVAERKHDPNEPIPEGWWLGRSDSSREAASNRVHDEQTKAKIRAATTGIRCYNNGVKNLKIREGDPVPDGFVPGMLKKWKNRPSA